MSNVQQAEGRVRMVKGDGPVPMVQRTKQFSLRVMKLVDALPCSRSAEVLGRQLLRSATSVGANYRAAQRARSKAEFIAKLGIVEEEADESCFWLELLAEGRIVPATRLTSLQQEANEITAIIVASLRSAKRKLLKKSNTESHRKPS